SLNLLSNEQKQELRIKKINLIIKKIMICLIITAIIIALLLFAAKTMLANSLDNINNTSYASSYWFNKEIIHVNNLIEFIEHISVNHKFWSEALIEMSENTPDGIIFSTLQINTLSNMLLITGIAQTRDSLLIFKDNLNKSIFFDNVNIPIQNLAEKTDINFSLSANFKIENLQ
ncbi:hypothetical protein COT95_02650, partial [Candidatus Falkowbacteria bacterium CG10_big_fil_rev_8_21_14_0_10_37_6]